MQEQDLKNYYRNVFTLRSGKTIEILTIDELRYDQNKYHDSWHIKGFITTPMIIDKTVDIETKEIACLESTYESHITWESTELDETNKD